MLNNSITAILWRPILKPKWLAVTVATRGVGVIASAGIESVISFAAVEGIIAGTIAENVIAPLAGWTGISTAPAPHTVLV